MQNPGHDTSRRELQAPGESSSAADKRCDLEQVTSHTEANYKHKGYTGVGLGLGCDRPRPGPRVRLPRALPTEQRLEARARPCTALLRPAGRSSAAPPERASPGAASRSPEAPGYQQPPRVERRRARPGIRVPAPLQIGRMQGSERRAIGSAASCLRSVALGPEHGTGLGSGSQVTALPDQETHRPTSWSPSVSAALCREKAAGKFKAARRRQGSWEEGRHAQGGGCKDAME